MVRELGLGLVLGLATAALNNACQNTACRNSACRHSACRNSAMYPLNQHGIFLLLVHYVIYSALLTVM